MHLYILIHYGPNPFSLKRIYAREEYKRKCAYATEGWRVERVTFAELRNLRKKGKWYARGRMDGGEKGEIV